MERKTLFFLRTDTVSLQTFASTSLSHNERDVNFFFFPCFQLYYIDTIITIEMDVCWWVRIANNGYYSSVNK